MNIPAKDKVQSLLLSVAKATVLSKFMCEVDVSAEAHTLEPEVLASIFTRIPWVHRYNRKQIFRRVVSRKYQRKQQINFPTEGEYIDKTTWRGFTIFIKLNIVREDHQDIRVIRFYTAKCKNDTQIIEDFVRMLRDKSDEIKRQWFDKYFQVISRGSSSSFCNSAENTRTTRSFKDVFIPKAARDKITNAIDHFIASEKWYKDKNIPYHFGILLQGPPGTGKSSVTQAIMNQWTSDAYVIPSSEVRWVLDTAVMNTWIYDNMYNIPRFIICEDVDTAVFGSETRAEVEDRIKDLRSEHERETELLAWQISKNVLGNVLNFMDGISSPSNVVYIFTTNHVDHLDPALIRPGRIDLIIEIGYADDETFDEFLMFHYKKHLPENRCVKDNLTFAMLQTKVMVGTSFEDLVNEYTYERS